MSRPPIPPGLRKKRSHVAKDRPAPPDHFKKESKAIDPARPKPKHVDKRR